MLIGIRRVTAATAADESASGLEQQREDTLNDQHQPRPTGHRTGPGGAAVREQRCMTGGGDYNSLSDTGR